MSATLVELTGDLPPSADLVIIGGGIVEGAATAFLLRVPDYALGCRTPPCPCSLTTPASTGAFRAQFDNQEEITLVKESIALFEHFAEVTGLPRLRPRFTPARLSVAQQRPRKVWERQNACGKPAHLGPHRCGVDEPADTVRKLFPYLAPDILGARFRAGRNGWLVCAA